MTLRDTLNDCVALLRRYLVLPDYGPETIALYTAQTFAVHEVGTFAPMLTLRSPEMRSGKTTTLDLIGELVRSPLAAANASPAALYRSMQERQVTLLLDEVDAYLKQKTEQSEAVRGILNAGHRRGRYSVVLRSNEKGELQTFNVFGPKVLSGIGKVAATLQDRSITLTLRRKLPTEKVERLRIARIEGELNELRERLEAAVVDVVDTIADADPALPPDLSDREADNWELMVALADAAGGEWPVIARQAAVTLSRAADRQETPQIQLLGDIAEYLADHEAAIIPSSELVGYLGTCEHAPWPGWNKGSAISAQQTATLLREFQTEDGEPIRPRKLSMGSAKIRGYRREWFQDAIRRYLGRELDGTAVEPGTPDEDGTPEPHSDNSLHGNDLGEYRPGTGYHPGRNHDTAEYHPGRNPVPPRNHHKPLHDNDLRDSGTGVPPETVGRSDADDYPEDFSDVFEAMRSEELRAATEKCNKVIDDLVTKTEDDGPDIDDFPDVIGWDDDGELPPKVSNPNAEYGWMPDQTSPVGGRLIEYKVAKDDRDTEPDDDGQVNGFDIF